MAICGYGRSRCDFCLSKCMDCSRGAGGRRYHACGADCRLKEVVLARGHVNDNSSKGDLRYVNRCWLDLGLVRFYDVESRGRRLRGYRCNRH